LKDPVCGMTVTDKSFYHVEQQGQTYYFCGAKCRSRFASDGMRHTGGAVLAKANGADKAAPQRGVAWRARWSLSLALLAALLISGYWLQTH
jgi:Cu+-exporting ATPase